MFKVLFDKSNTHTVDQASTSLNWEGMTIADIQAMEELMELWEEGGLGESDLVEADSLDLAAGPPSSHTSTLRLDCPPFADQAST